MWNFATLERYKRIYLVSGYLCCAPLKCKARTYSTRVTNSQGIFFRLSYYYRPIIGGSILYYLFRESPQNQFLQTIRTLRRLFIYHAYHFWLYITEVRLIRKSVS